MKWHRRALAAGLVFASLGAFACDDDEPTEEEAIASFCADVEEVSVAMEEAASLDADSSVEDLEEARDRAQDAVSDIGDSGAGVSEARRDEVEQSFEQLSDAIDDIDEDQSIEVAFQSISDEVVNVQEAISAAGSEVEC